MKDNETEAYFLARGWTSRADGEWFNYIGSWQERLPNILESYPAFKEHVLEVMEGEGYKSHMYNVDGKVFWQWWRTGRLLHGDQFEEEIINNNILHAATISATKYFQSKVKP